MRACGGVQDRKICVISTFFSPDTFLTSSPHSADAWAPAHTGAAPRGEQSCDCQQWGGAGAHPTQESLGRNLTWGYQRATPANPLSQEHQLLHGLVKTLQEGTRPACRLLAPKGSTTQAQGRRAFNFFLFTYFCINFSFSWLFSVQWPLEFGFFDSWRDARKTHSASKEIHNLAFKGNSIKWYGCSLILYLTSELSSHLSAPKWLKKESSQERFKGTVGKRKPAPHPTFLPTQSRRLSGERRIHTRALWKEENVSEATDAEATWAASHSQLLNLYKSRINCINSGV